MLILVTVAVSISQLVAVMVIWQLQLNVIIRVAVQISWHLVAIWAVLQVSVVDWTIGGHLELFSDTQLNKVYHARQVWDEALKGLMSRRALMQACAHGRGARRPDPRVIMRCNDTRVSRYITGFMYIRDAVSTVHCYRSTSSSPLWLRHQLQGIANTHLELISVRIESI